MFTVRAKTLSIATTFWCPMLTFSTVITEFFSRWYYLSTAFLLLFLPMHLDTIDWLTFTGFMSWFPTVYTNTAFRVWLTGFRLLFLYLTYILTFVFLMFLRIMYYFKILISSLTKWFTQLGKVSLLPLIIQSDQISPNSW